MSDPHAPLPPSATIEEVAAHKQRQLSGEPAPVKAAPVKAKKPRK